MGSGGMLTASARMLRSPVRQIFAPASIRDQSVICTVEQLSPLIPKTRGVTTTQMMLADRGNMSCALLGMSKDVAWSAEGV